MRFEKYYVGNTNKHKGLFHQLRGKEAAPNRVPDGTFNMINETSTNNGITKKAFSEHIFSAPAITVSVNYASTVFMQVEDFCASVNIIILKSDWLCKYNRAGLYIVTLLKKNNQRYDYAYKISKDRLNETIIELPTLDELDSNSPYSDNGYIPDFEYMEKYIAELEQERIAELEQERIAELEQYLIATGLNDYTLTDEDKAVLSLHNAEWGNEDRDNAVVDGVRFEKFELGKLFVKIDTVKIKLQKSNCPSEAKEGFEIPARTATTTNQGLSCYVPRDSCTILNNKISVSANGDFAAFWHDSEFTILQDSYALGGNGYELTSGIALYSIACMYRTLGNRYNWTNKSGWNKIRNEVIELPVIDEIDPTHKYHKDGHIPDFGFMERYIKAMQKVVIADVVKYKDEVIAQTKALVNK